MKRLAFLLIALAFPACCQPPPNYCGPNYMLDIWRVQITTTDANPQAQIDAVIDNTGGTAVIPSGQLTLGVTESPTASIDVLNYYDPATFSDECTLGIKTVTLLEKSGVPFGKKINRYLLVVSPSGYQYNAMIGVATTTSTVSGKVRYDIYDVTDTLVSTVNATFTGASISGIAYASDGDPFWTVPQ